MDSKRNFNKGYFTVLSEYNLEYLFQRKVSKFTLQAPVSLRKIIFWEKSSSN
jgi:hypothetical protein